MLWVTSVCRAVQSWSHLGSWKHHVLNNNHNQFSAVLLKSFFSFCLSPYTYVWILILPTEEGKKKAERGVIKIQYIKLTFLDLQQVIIILHAWLVLCCEKAEQVEHCLSNILPPDNRLHLQTPHAPAWERHCQDQTEGWVRKIDGGSWTEAAGKVGFALTWVGLKSSLASTFLLNLLWQWLYLLTMGVKKKKKL